MQKSTVKITIKLANFCMVNQSEVFAMGIQQTFSLGSNDCLEAGQQGRLSKLFSVLNCIHSHKHPQMIS